MKTQLSILALIGLTVLVGCTTTSVVTNNPDGTSTTNTVKTLDIAKTTNAINAAVPVVVRLAIQKTPESRKYLSDAALAIMVFTSTSQTFDPDALNKAILDAVGGDVLSPDAISAIDAAIALYKAYYGDAVLAKLNSRPWLIPILNSLSQSILKGLAPPTN